VLINYVLGVRFVSPAGAEWSVEPFLMGLEGAEGGFWGVRGWWGVKWVLERDSGTSPTRGGTLTLNLSTPPSTNGTFSIPACNGVVSAGGISVDGKKVSGTGEGEGEGVVEVMGGNRTISVRFDSVAPI